MRAFRRIVLSFIAGTAAAALLVVSAYAALLAYAWFADRPSALAEPRVGAGDFSRLSRASNVSVVVPHRDARVAIEQLQQLVREAAAQKKKITIAGAKHSMGGHTLLDGSLCIDMRCDAFRRIEPVITRDGVPLVRVGAGATWHELLAALDREGWSVAVMQSNDDFTIGGSVSVNCHGWQPHAPPIDSTVEAFRILLADGSVHECRRDRNEDRELFRAVCGGYGLLGVILNVDLRVIPNALYKAEEFAATSENYASRFKSLVSNSNVDIGLAYGRISVAPGKWFLRDARIIRFVAAAGHEERAVTNSVASNGGHFSPAPWEIALARAAFRASAMSNFGKLGRWAIERIHGQTHRVVSRNGILQTPSDWFANRDPAFTEILHEYFIPPEGLAEFLERIRPLLQHERDVDLLNITVRDVQRDADSVLAYAQQEMLGLVMLFRYRATKSGDEEMRRITEPLIDAALACGGTYYLPYRPHATREQFQHAYARSAEFYELKRKYDPQEIFENTFYLRFIRPTE